MTLYKFTNGTVANANEVNANFNTAISFPILNKIRQQQDRSVDISNNKDDIFSDAYIDASGRENTVNTSNTTAVFQSTGLYYENDNATTSGTTESNFDSRSNTNHSSDVRQQFIANADLIVTEVRYNIHDTNGYSADATVTINLGTGSTDTLATKAGSGSGNGLKTVTFNLSDHSTFIPAGSVFNVRVEMPGQDLASDSSAATFTGTLYDNSTASGAANKPFVGNGGIEVTKMVGTTSTTKVVEHVIPSGTFPSDVDKLIGKALIKDTETGATITHRLENATENSGDIADGELGTFTAFTSEPTKYIVKLTSKSTGTPTAGYPRIKGSGVYSE